MLWLVIQCGNILAGPHLSISNPVLSALSSAPTITASASATSTTASQAYTFSIKIVSAKKKSDYAVQTLHLNGRFSSLDALKQAVLSKCEDRISMETGFGFIEPGHGVSGKKEMVDV